MLPASIRSQKTLSVEEHSIPGGWTEQGLRIGGRELRLVMPADPDRFLEEISADPSDPREADPYWAELWPAALPMAEAMMRMAWEPGQRVLEIGCGIGLVGLAALARGCSVTLSDYVATAVNLAVENARRNGFNEVHGMLLDWRCPHDEEYSAIVASDILYYSHQHEVLLDLLDRMLADDGTCWLGDPGRFQAEDFMLRAIDRAYTVQLFDERDAEIFTPRSRQFQLLRLQR